MPKHSVLIAVLIMGWSLAATWPQLARASDVTTTAVDPAQIDFFEKRIRPVLAEHCYECHAESADDVMGGLLLDSRDGSRQGGDSGPAVVPFAPDKSRLLEAMSYANRELQMPPENRLPKNVVDDFRKWIAMGAADPRSRSRVKRQRIGFDLTARKATHWAWRAPRQSTQGVDIDELIDQHLHDAGLTAVPRAEPRKLVRRLSFDLIGLPPTPQESRRFLVDWEVDPAVAIEELVDRLLADTRFGEHWARHWLDVVRYAETKGHVTDQERPFVWKYRDYVIDAFNADLPYDRFVAEQIAGDLMDETQHRVGRQGESNVTPTATGALFMHEMHFMAVDPVRQRWDEINAQIDLLSKAFLGLTVECARCHDHKFDAISQADYYALAGFFYSTEQGRARTGPRLPPLAEAKELSRLEKNYEQFLKSKQAGRLKAQAPKASGKYFPVSEELGIQSPADSARLFKFMRALETADPSWGFWARSAQDVEGRDVNLLIRGDHRNAGAVVQRRFLTAIGGDYQPQQRELGTGSGRLWLAAQVTSPDNPLVARVWVNRLWHHLFGRGIVATPNNFGKLGLPPSHPELLDYLAARLIEESWSTKAMIREIVRSRAYQRTSDSFGMALGVDPENRLLARQNRRRLTAEQLRDAMLYVAGVLDPTMRGPSVDCYVPPYATANKASNIPTSGPLDGGNRRSIYLKVRRLFYDPFLLTFDFPDRGKSIGRRPVTIVPSQSLAMLNSPLVHELADDWARLLVAGGAIDSPDDLQRRLDEVWQKALGRPVNADERATMRQLIEEFAHGDRASREAWKDMIHVVFNHPEFMWID